MPAKSSKILMWHFLNTVPGSTMTWGAIPRDTSRIGSPSNIAFLLYTQFQNYTITGVMPQVGMLVNCMHACLLRMMCMHAYFFRLEVGTFIKS
mmetsp:Transcript_38/g.100  ORF Transcript_38/g.100 Transcript_38/m.100 type:complete len:93 (-) Transcript_38:29-307(-)